MTDGCRGCGERLPAPFLDLGALPLANALVHPDRASETDARFPLAVSYCAGCHLVQLTETVDPADLFSDYLYFSSYSESFVAHARAMADDLSAQLNLSPGSRVLEVASNDGYLLQFFKARGIQVLGLEPARNVAAVAQERGIPTWTMFFGPDAARRVQSEYGPVDLLVGNNVLAHVPSINEFLAATRSVLADQGVAVFEFPYVGDLLDHLEFDTIYHEHVFYYSLSALNTLARRAGLTITDVSHQAVHGGSLRVALRPGRTVERGRAAAALLDDERRTGLQDARRYHAFSDRVRELQSALNARLRNLKDSGLRLAAYGAPAKGNTLLNSCGIGVDLLEFTVDANPHKQGLLLPGSRLPVLAPEELLRRRPDVTLILPWNIQAEIVRQQQAYLSAGGRFMVPIPHPKEVAA